MCAFPPYPRLVVRVLSLSPVIFLHRNYGHTTSHVHLSFVAASRRPSGKYTLHFSTSLFYSARPLGRKTNVPSTRRKGVFFLQCWCETFLSRWKRLCLLTNICVVKQGKHDVINLLADVTVINVSSGQDVIVDIAFYVTSAVNLDMIAY